MFQSKEIANLKAELETAKADLITSNTAREAAQARVTALEAELATAKTDHEAALAKAKADHEAALAAALTAQAADEQTRTAAAVTDALASAGVPETKLPARSASSTSADTEEDLVEQINATTDPVQAGKLVAKLKAVRAAAAAKN